MPETLFLASKGIGGLSSLFDRPLSELRLLFVPTATKVYDYAPWIDADRITLGEMGFQLSEVDLDEATPDEVIAAMADVDIVYLQGGNTFFLLQAMQKCDFAAALRANPDIVYAGASAGAVVAGLDVDFVKSIDDKAKAPELASTNGLRLVPFDILPHMDYDAWRVQLDEIAKGYKSEHPSGTLLTLRDDQALVVRNGVVSTIEST